MPASFTHINGNWSQSSQTTILVVDDDRFIRELCTQALNKYRIVQAGTCEEAILQYETEHPDLILTDISMPGGSGIDLLRSVKTLDPNATVVIMTGFVNTDIILSALKEDADDFINKPLNILQLRTSIEKALVRKALKQELADIKRSDEIKNTFLSLVSHKLRTPITGISLFLQNLRMGVFKLDDPLFQQCINMASEEAHYLAQLVGELLEFSQVMVDGTGIDKSSCDLNEIVADVLIKCRKEHGALDIGLEAAPEVLPPVLLDASKISFTLYQVLDNAIKFSNGTGHISLKLGRQEDFVFIVVSDTGVGIPESELPKVFEKFYQVDPNHTGQIRGFGLGLFYARDFIRQHGGIISIASKPDFGTTVTISLPLQ